MSVAADQFKYTLVGVSDLAPSAVGMEGGCASTKAGVVMLSSGLFAEQLPAASQAEMAYLYVVEGALERTELTVLPRSATKTPFA